MYILPQKKIKYNHGFTLIELMVSISIFLIVLIMGLGAYTTTLQSHKKSNSKANAMYSMHYVFDIVLRNLRTGFSYRVPVNDNECNLNGKQGGHQIVFSDQDNNEVEYIFKKEDNIGTLRSKINNGNENFLTDRNSVNIENVCFYVTGTTSGDKVQPRVFIYMKGLSNYKGQKDAFAIQSLVSARLLDKE